MDKLITFTGPWDSLINVQIYITKQEVVMPDQSKRNLTLLRFPNIITKTTKKTSTIESITNLENEYCPTYELNMSVYITDNGKDKLGTLIITQKGHIIIYSDDKMNAFNSSQQEDVNGGLYNTEIQF